MFLKWSIFWLGWALFGISVVGGGAISRALAGWPEAFLAWKIGLGFLLLRTVIAALIWQRSRISIRYAFYSRAVLVVDMSAIFAGLGLPIFFILPVWEISGFNIFFACILSSAIHIYQGIKHFDNQWKNNGQSAIAKALKGNFFDTDKFIKSLNLSPPFFDLKNQALSFTLKATLVISMLVGLNIRKLYPEFAAIAWGLPALLMLSWTAQSVVMFMLQARTVAQYEKHTGLTFT